MKIIDKVAFIKVKDGKVLLTRSKGKRLFYLPGGKRIGNETDLETLKREIKEELLVDIDINSAEYYGTFYAEADGKAPDVIVKMTCYTAEYYGELQVDNEIDEMEWLAFDGISRVSKVCRFVFFDLHYNKLLL